MILDMFAFCSVWALSAATLVVSAPNPVLSVICLIVVFCNAAGIMLLLDLDFFAMIFLVVYVGAIAVLFLFVVMMLNINVTTGREPGESKKNNIVWVWLASLPFVVLALESADDFGQFISSLHVMTTKSYGWELSGNSYGLENTVTNLVLEAIKNTSQLDSWTSPQTFSTIEVLGHVLYTTYVFYFIMASLILLVAMIGAIVLTMHKGTVGKKQEVYEQNRREFENTIHKIRQ